MTKTLDPVVRAVSRGQPDGDLAPRPRSYDSGRIRGLSDRQTVIAAMVASGATCRDIAFELLLPLRTVQGHLLTILRILDLPQVEDLTHEVIAAHHARNLGTAATRSARLRAVGAEKSADGKLSNSLVALDAAEASHGTQVADLTLELAAVRAELDEQYRKVQQLHEAVDSRDSIGQAKGILMERHKISAAAAFKLLQEESNRSHRKLADVAKALIFSGEGIAGARTAATLHSTDRRTDRG